MSWMNDVVSSLDTVHCLLHKIFLIIVVDNMKATCSVYCIAPHKS